MRNKDGSYELDSTKVTAPFVRIAQKILLEGYVNKEGETATITKFDVRFSQPNEKYMPNDALHSLEHFLSIYTREYADNIIDISPLGCRTGFLMSVSGDKGAEWAVNIITKSLGNILEMDKVPGCTPTLCANYLEHDIDGAKLWAGRFLSVSKNELTAVNRI